MTLVLIIAAFVALLLLVWWLDPLRWYEKKLAARDSLSDESMIEQYFATGSVPHNVPGKVRQIFAKHMAYPVEKLLPDDDLNVFWTDFDMSEIIDEFRETFQIEIADADCERTRCTIRSVSELIVNKMRV